MRFYFHFEQIGPNNISIKKGCLINAECVMSITLRLLEVISYGLCVFERCY